jgi:hypothetical protein
MKYAGRHLMPSGKTNRAAPSEKVHILETTTPTGCDLRCAFSRGGTPLGFCLSDPLAQGSSFLATLGFGTQSLWDWDWQIFKI